MDIDSGFDMVPRLIKGAVDRHNWLSFIERIKERYEDDDQVEIKPNYIEFNAGEHPLLPFEGTSSCASAPRYPDGAAKTLKSTS
jgi:hypothetical protein